MRTVIVTLGRCTTAGKVLALKVWREFQEDVEQAMLDERCTIIQAPSYDSKRSHDQIGVWEGNEEPACTFVALMPNDYRKVESLRYSLSRIAHYYEQAAIGYVNVLGADHLVEAAAQ